jgi:hypothetical protein
MGAFLFQCPATGRRVQGWVADDGSTVENEIYLTVTCLACLQAHLVNPKTGKVLGLGDE